MPMNKKTLLGNVIGASSFRVTSAVWDFFTIECWRVPGKSYLSTISHPVEDWEDGTEREKNLVSRVALQPGKFFPVRKVFSKRTKKIFEKEVNKKHNKKI